MHAPEFCGVFRRGIVIQAASIRVERLLAALREFAALRGRGYFSRWSERIRLPRRRRVGRSRSIPGIVVSHGRRSGFVSGPFALW